MHEIWIASSATLTPKSEELEEEGELIRESATAAAKRAQQFVTIKELLMTAAELGTS